MSEKLIVMRQWSTLNEGVAFPSFVFLGALIGGLDSPSVFTKPTGIDGIPHVTAQDLYNLLTEENVSKVLVLDCRSHSMFHQNRINRPSCINIPAELLDQG